MCIHSEKRKCLSQNKASRILENEVAIVAIDQLRKQL